MKIPPEALQRDGVGKKQMPLGFILFALEAFTQQIFVEWMLQVFPTPGRGSVIGSRDTLNKPMWRDATCSEGGGRSGRGRNRIERRDLEALSRWAWLPSQAGDLPSEGLSQGSVRPRSTGKARKLAAREEERPPGLPEQRAPVSPTTESLPTTSQSLNCV